MHPRSRVYRCANRGIVTCFQEEIKKMVYKRLESVGRDARTRPSTSDIHPLVTETWKAMEEVYGLGVIETPLRPSPWLHAFAGEEEGPTRSGGSVHLKLESSQVTGSFKARGAAHKLLSIPPDQLRVTCSSTGNHALGVLHAASALAKAGRPVDLTIYIPTTVTPQKVAKLQAAAAKCGAKIITIGQDCVESENAARAAAEAEGKIYVSPYNDTAVAGGQGTLALELLMSLPPSKLDAVFVPVGGGGLISGVAALIKSLDPQVKIYGCQPEASDVMRQSVEAGGTVVELKWQETLSDATAGGIEHGALTVDACMKFVDEWITVTEPQIAAAMVGIHGHHGVAIEGAAGVAVASYIKVAKEQMRGKHAVVVVCGGNVAAETLDKAYEHVAKEKAINPLSSRG
jgi:threonine dehydratase